MERVTVKGTKPTSTVVKAEEEKWRNSSVYPEIMVSSRGKVKEREYQRVVKDPEDGCFRIYAVPAKTLETKISNFGDVVVSFYSGRKFITESVAFLVAKEFVPNDSPDRFKAVKFKDKDRTNLNASNLFWDGAGAFSRSY